MVKTSLGLPKFEIEVDGIKYTGIVAECGYFKLGDEDHGLFTALVGFTWKGSGQGLAPYGMTEYDKDTKETYGTAFGCAYIMECVRVLGSPERAKGSRVVLLKADGDSWGEILGVAPLMNDGSIGKPFFPRKLAEEYRAREGTK